MRFRTHLLTHACYAAEDGTGASDAAPQDAAPDAPATDAPPAPDAAPEAPAAPAAAQPPAWYQQRINELSRSRGDEQRGRQQAERERDELRAKVQPDPNAPPDPAAERRFTQADVDRLSKIQGQQIADGQVHQAAVNRTMEAGKAEYTQLAFNAACNALADVGATERPEFLALVADLPNGHDVLHRLGTDPAEAIRILGLPSLRMAAEIGRISAAEKVAPAAAAPKAVSKAPPPVEPVGGGGSSATETDPDKMTPGQYAAWFDKRQVARRSRA